MLYVAEGCAHGYLSLADGSEIRYLTSQFYEPDAATGVRYDDPALGIDWPAEVRLVSDRDREGHSSPRARTEWRSVIILDQALAQRAADGNPSASRSSVRGTWGVGSRIRSSDPRSRARRDGKPVGRACR